jgi:predicted DNA-binding antitoxin AbrB/MazE fold protein
MAEETELDEGRGRPRKDGTKSDTDDREHIQMQLRKSVSLRGLKDVEFDDGKKVKVPAKVAQGVMSKINSIKDAKQKHNAVQHIAKSHKHMMDFHKGDYKDADAKRQDILKLK